MSVKQQEITPFVSVFSILDWVEAFILDRKSRGLSPNTISLYRKKLKKFLQYCELNQIHDIQEIQAKNIRKYILWLKDKGHNKGGVHTHFRVLRSFLYWYEIENNLKTLNNLFYHFRQFHYQRLWYLIDKTFKIFSCFINLLAAQLIYLTTPRS